MLIFNFHKIMDMHKGYAYQFSEFLLPTKNLESVCVCVVFSYFALKESSDLLQSAKCKHLIVLTLSQTLIPNT
jgi:hypothetical protein